MSDKVELTYQGNKFPAWLVALWVAFLIWMIAYILHYAAPNLGVWLSSNPMDRFVQ
jgi:hypothetical protein